MVRRGPPSAARERRTRPVRHPPYASRHHPAAHPRRPGRTTLFRETAHALDPPPSSPAALPAARGGRDRPPARDHPRDALPAQDRKSTRLNSSHVSITYTISSLKKQILHYM